MRIRLADPERDAAPCSAIYAPFVRDTAISFEERAPDERELGRRIAATARTHPWLVADDGDQVLGYAYGCPHRARAAYRWAADVSVYVDQVHRRRGVGRALYIELFERLREQGLYVACAGVTLPNDASVAFHESLGFVAVGVFRQIGFKLGRWWDVGWWQLELTQPGVEPAEPAGPSGR